MSTSTPGSASPTPAIVIDAPGTSAVTFYAYDSTDQRFFIRGRIDTYSDYLKFRIRTRLLGTGDQSVIPAEKFFDAMMSHFQTQPGGLPTAIHAIWEDSDPDFVTNLERFNDSMLAGNDETTAATMTFTGRMAIKYHYSVVVRGVSDPPHGPPPYKKINFYFRT